jgi:hypothetical protein
MGGENSGVVPAPRRSLRPSSGRQATEYGARDRLRRAAVALLAAAPAVVRAWSAAGDPANIAAAMLAMACLSGGARW